MGRLTVRLPDALHRQLETLARSEGVSLNQYLVYALTRQATLDAQQLESKGNGRQKTSKAVNRKSASEQGAAGDLPDDVLPPPSDE